MEKFVAGGATRRALVMLHSRLIRRMRCQVLIFRSHEPGRINKGTQQYVTLPPPGRKKGLSNQSAAGRWGASTQLLYFICYSKLRALGSHAFGREEAGDLQWKVCGRRRDWACAHTASLAIDEKDTMPGLRFRSHEAGAIYRGTH